MQRHLWRAFATFFLIYFLFCFTTFAEELKKMSIVGVPQDPNLELALGNAWAIYLDGPITQGDAKRLEQYIVQHHIPAESWAILNSPGGNLFEGMELGRIIRKHRLRTDIGRRKQNPSHQFDVMAGGCYSACTLAYIGGAFRFLSSGSHFGIHRFAFTSPQKNESDIAQIASASIVAYLRSMDCDPEFFTLSTKAGSEEIFEPSKHELEQLNVVTNGFSRPKWSIESNNGILYLKGERDTVYGINKFVMYCENPPRMSLVIIFDPQRRETEVMGFQAHSLMINDQQFPIIPVEKKIVNGWFNSVYALTPEQLAYIATARSVGVVVQAAYNAPIFLGFNNMPFEEGAKKLVGLLNSCGFARNGYRLK